MEIRALPERHEVVVVPRFLTAAEHEALLRWALGEFGRGRLLPNKAGPGRYFARYTDSDPALPDAFAAAKARAIRGFDIASFEEEPRFRCFLGCNTEGGFVHPHVDQEPPGRHHIRLNIMLSKPDSGGLPIVDGRPLAVGETDLWCFHPAALRHGSTPVAGSRPRFVLSIGLLVPAVFEGPLAPEDIEAYRAWQETSRPGRADRRRFMPTDPVFEFRPDETAGMLPDVMAALESRLPLAEIVRFPQQSPHAIPRAYWENQIAVRARLPRFYARAGDPAGFVGALGGLHRLATLGESGRNYYDAGGGVVTVPGELRSDDLRTTMDAPMLRALQEWSAQFGVPDGLRLSGTVDAGGHPALIRRGRGRVCVHVRGDGTPVRALLERARLALVHALETVAVRDVPAVSASAAAFHAALVAAHPFGNANNSLAMNIVNDILRAAGLGPLPHLLLDHLALRLATNDYETVFGRLARDPAMEFSRGTSARNRTVPLLHLLMRAQRAAAVSRGSSAG
jgi:hypothetical protein